jgi:hypothetical protein
MYGRCIHGRVGNDGCPVCEEQSYMRTFYANEIQEQFPGCAWDDLTDSEQAEIESAVEWKLRERA